MSNQNFFSAQNLQNTKIHKNKTPTPDATPTIFQNHQIGRAIEYWYNQILVAKRFSSREINYTRGGVRRRRSVGGEH
jgi:hypothetical protein